MKIRTRSRRVRRFETLETRRCLAATISVVNGDLLIQGDAVSPIQIVTELNATTGGTDFVVKEGVAGTEVARFANTDVTDDIRIYLDTDGTTITNDDVTIDLSAGTVAIDRIYASLGDGTNSLTLLAGSSPFSSIRGNLQVRGGSGNDTVTVETGASVGAVSMRVSATATTWSPLTAWLVEICRSEPAAGTIA